MYDGAQPLEKNHFPLPQNRSTSLAMLHNMKSMMAEKERSRRRTHLFLLLMALAIAAATLAPVAVLAAQLSG